MIERESRFNQPGRSVIDASSSGRPSEPDVLSALVERSIPHRGAGRYPPAATGVAEAPQHGRAQDENMSFVSMEIGLSLSPACTLHTA